ncbi:MAG: macro domain-containing protein [Roseiflexaceae bacterium]
MIAHITGNLLEADVEALVNTVNTVGVMGKGIALQFRQAYPENYQIYQAACKRGEVVPGKMLVYETNRLENPKYIINFPTKRHWKQKSQIQDIDAGLVSLVAEVRARNIHSIALPPLGCGNGGLEWNDVRPRIEQAFNSLPHVYVLVFAPDGAPIADSMSINTRRPNMTLGRAAVIELIKRYAIPGYRVTMLEIEKLAYFLQEAGQPLKLHYTKGQYGPYTETLHPVLQRIDGHFIRGYGDRSRGASIHLLPGADLEAEDFLQEDDNTRMRLERVTQLITGFETPYSLELLATIHWIAHYIDANAANDVTTVIHHVHSWNKRKQRFPSEHIKLAWQRLRNQGWLHIDGATVSDT